MGTLIPADAIDLNGFEINSTGNIFLILLLNLNWNDWKRTFPPTRTFGREELDLVRLEDERSIWTQVRADDYEFLQRGVQQWDQSQYTTAFIKTNGDWSRQVWNPIWKPTPYFSVSGSPITLDIGIEQPMRWVFVTCELCGEDPEEFVECEHWDGLPGSWVSLDFVPSPSEVESFLVSLAQSADLDGISIGAASFLIQQFLLPTNRDQEADVWTDLILKRLPALSNDVRKGLEGERLLPNKVRQALVQGS